jgi:hypothetical protein
MSRDQRSICYWRTFMAVETIPGVEPEEDTMKKTKPAAVNPENVTTPATPAPSPVKKAKAPAKAVAPVVQSDTTRRQENSPAPAVKTQAAIPLSTTIIAQIDVGFGNTLYIRGDGPGLSWEKGTKLACVADDKWSIVLAETSKPIVFKFLINDLTWCSGDDNVARPGATVNVSPVF